jgi:hypothetical protein
VFAWSNRTQAICRRRAVSQGFTTRLCFPSFRISRLSGRQRGAEGPRALQKDQNFDRRYRLGGLQSLAAAGPDKDPDIGQMLVSPNKASIGLRGAEGLGVLQDVVKA